MSGKPITRRGYDRLFWRLEYLRRQARREVAADLEAARGHGLTMRNLEWRTAREKQAWVEGRIEDLEEQLETCEVVLTGLGGSAGRADRADFGCRVTIKCADEGEETTWTLVGPYESDASQGLLSVESPAGRAVFGGRIGDWVTFICPTGLRTVQIKAIVPPGDGRPVLMIEEALDVGDAS